MIYFPSFLVRTRRQIFLTSCACVGPKRVSLFWSGQVYVSLFGPAVTQMVKYCNVSAGMLIEGLFYFLLLSAIYNSLC